MNLAKLRQQRTLPPQPELDPAHPRRRNPLSLEQQKKRAKDLLRGLRSNMGTRLPVFSTTCLSLSPVRGAHECMMHSK